jgi:3-oxoacyl-[acyl-carrier protein] reductase
MGRCFASKLAEAGVNVAMCDIQEDLLKEAAEAVGKGGSQQILMGKTDVSRSSEVKAFAKHVEEKLGSIDILLNNAAIHPLHPIEEISEEEWDTVMAVDLKSCFLFARAVLPGMRKRKFGRIISIASEAGKNGGTICGLHYASAKGAILAFTRNLAKQVGSDGITVNAIAPGRIATPMARAVSDDANQIFIRRSAVKRLGSAEDVANAVLFLADRDASFITGETLNVNGGTLMD